MSLKIERSGYEIQISAGHFQGRATVFLDDRTLDLAGEGGIKKVSAHIASRHGDGRSYDQWVAVAHRQPLGSGNIYAADLLKGELEMAGPGAKVELVMTVEQGESRKSRTLAVVSVADFLLGRAR